MRYTNNKIQINASDNMTILLNLQTYTFIYDTCYELLEFSNQIKIIDSSLWNYSINMITGTKYDEINSSYYKRKEVSSHCIPKIFNSPSIKKCILNYFKNTNIYNYNIIISNEKIIKYKPGDYYVNNNNNNNNINQYDNWYYYLNNNNNKIYFDTNLKFILVLEAANIGGNLVFRHKTQNIKINMNQGSVYIIDSNANYFIDQIIEGKNKFFECDLSFILDSQKIKNEKILEMLTGEYIQTIKLTDIIKETKKAEIKEEIKKEEIKKEEKIKEGVKNEIKNKNNNKIFDMDYIFGNK